MPCKVHPDALAPPGRGHGELLAVPPGHGEGAVGRHGELREVLADRIGHAGIRSDVHPHVGIGVDLVLDQPADHRAGHRDGVPPLRLVARRGDGLARVLHLGRRLQRPPFGEREHRGPGGAHETEQANEKKRQYGLAHRREVLSQERDAKQWPVAGNVVRPLRLGTLGAGGSATIEREKRPSASPPRASRASFYLESVTLPASLAVTLRSGCGPRPWPGTAPDRPPRAARSGIRACGAGPRWRSPRWR